MLPDGPNHPQKTRRIFRAASPTEMIYIATGTIVVSRSSIAGAVRREQFEAAVQSLENRYSILRSAVEDGQFVERGKKCSPIETWVPSHISSTETLYLRLLNSGLDTGSGIYRIHVIADPDGIDVFMLSSHAVTDATALVELHSCLAYMCDCVVRGVPPDVEEQAFPEPVDAAVVKILAAIPPNRLRQLPADSAEFAQIPMRAGYQGGAVIHALERVTISPEAVQRLSHAAHAHGSSVHSLLLAAFALAIGEVAEGRPKQLLMRSTVDMRRRLAPHVSTELVFSAVTGHITPITDLEMPFFEMARSIFEDIHQGVENGSIFRDYVTYPRVFGSAQQAPVALNVSDMQRVEFRWPLARLKVTGFEYALGWLKTFPNVSVSIYEGKLIATVVYVEEFVDVSIIRAIVQRFLDRLAFSETPTPHTGMG
jgi:hypothetical protein